MIIFAAARELLPLQGLTPACSEASQHTHLPLILGPPKNWLLLIISVQVL